MLVMSLLLPRPCSARIFNGRPVRLQRGRCARWRLLAKTSLSLSLVSHHQASFLSSRCVGVVACTPLALLDSGTLPRKKPARSLMSDGMTKAPRL